MPHSFAVLLIPLHFASPGEGAVNRSLGAPELPFRAPAADRAASTASPVEPPRPRIPEWLEELAAILRGEGMEEGKGWWGPSSSLYTWTWLRDRFDRTKDKRIELAEAPDLREHFDRLDRNEDGFITEDDLEGPEPPEPSALVRGLFRRLDSDTNDRISWDELSWFFQQADRRKRGFITRRDLAAAFADLLLETKEPAPGAPRADPTLSRWKLLQVFLTGHLSSFGEGPALGGEAPDLSLLRLDGKETFRLWSARGKRPVVLIFGSFT